jgi:phage terminase large subunit-like protein
MSSDFTPLDMLYALVLETGEEWGQVAAPFQLADAEAILGENGPRRHFLTRPRGGSKTTDLAGLALAWLAVAAPPMSRGYVVAANVDQAAILIDAAAGFVARTPALSGTVEVQNEKIIGPEGAWMRVLACSDSGAWGLRDARFLILDEFAQWPETRGAKRVYLAVRTTV